MQRQLRQIFRPALFFLHIPSPPPTLNDFPVSMPYGPRRPKNRVRLAAHMPRAVCNVNVLPQDSILCALPAEMKLHIFEQLGDVERTYLAVTCKDMAQDVNSYTDIEMAKSREQQLATTRTPTIKQKLGFLWHMQNEQWVKNGRYKLCVDCTRFKPKSGSWGGDSKLLTAREPSRDVQIQGPHCLLALLPALNSELIRDAGPGCVERNRSNIKRQKAIFAVVKRASAA